MWHGGLNWYRNIDRNRELLAPFAGAAITVPALYIAGDRDLVVAFRGMDQAIFSLAKFVPHLKDTIIRPGCGHWTQQERAAEVNRVMVNSLRTAATPPTSTKEVIDPKRTLGGCCWSPRAVTPMRYFLI